jgi:hypothetical protein
LEPKKTPSTSTASPMKPRESGSFRARLVGALLIALSVAGLTAILAQRTEVSPLSFPQVESVPSGVPNRPDSGLFAKKSEITVSSVGLAPIRGESDESAGEGSLSPLSPEEEAAQERNGNAFRAEGWQRVEESPPQESLLSLSPEIARDSLRSSELLTQLRTQTPNTSEEIENAGRIAEDFSLDEKFRRASIEALTRSDDPVAQGVLMRIAGSTVHSELERTLALSGVRPTSGRDAAAVFLKEWVESEKFPESLKDQAAATWVGRALLDGGTRDESLAQWSPRARPRILRTWNLLTGGGLDSSTRSANQRKAKERGHGWHGRNDGSGDSRR